MNDKIGRKCSKANRLNENIAELEKSNVVYNIMFIPINYYKYESNRIRCTFFFISKILLIFPLSRLCRSLLYLFSSPHNLYATNIFFTFLLILLFFRRCLHKTPLPVCDMRFGTILATAVCYVFVNLFLSLSLSLTIFFLVLFLNSAQPN